MDMMTRRAVMMAMAQGSNVIKGTFTAVKDNNNQFEFSFGKSLPRYMFLFEMTESSKTSLMESSQTGAKSYLIMGIYPKTKVGNYTSDDYIYWARFNPSTGAMTQNSSIGGTYTDSSVKLPCGANLNAGANFLYDGYTYDYMIIPIE